MSPDGSVAGVLAAAAVRLRAAGNDAARGDAALLLAEAMRLPRLRLLTEPARRLAAAERRHFEALLDRRLAGEPVSRVLGRRAFWSLELAIDPAVLDPRADSETVVQAALEALPDPAAALRILDLGTGSGCLLLALLAERPAAWGVGLDRAAGAAARARDNARRCGLADRAAFLVGDWSAAIAGGRFHLVVANPPYIPSAEIAGLAPEVRSHDPRLALDGGADGLDAYRRLAGLLPGLLAPGGTVVLECGLGQADAVAALLAGAGLGEVRRRRDLAGIDRVVVAVAPTGGVFAAAQKNIGKSGLKR